MSTSYSDARDPNARARAFAITTCHRRCVDLLKTGIFSSEGMKSPLFEAAVVNLLINLNDLVRKAANDGKRITSTAHVDVVEGVGDVTDLITKCRNAACHIESPLQNIDSNRCRFNFVIGQGTGPGMNGVELRNDFQDDIAIFYGAYRLYIKRHVIETLQQLEQIYPAELAN